MKYLHHFRWDSSVPATVSIKGSFDNWNQSLQLQKLPSGKFSAPIQLEFGSKVTYKYVVDGAWRHNPNEPTETDLNGNLNNVFHVPKPSPTQIDPASQSISTCLHPATSPPLSDASVQDSNPNSPLQDIPIRSNPTTNAESSTPAEMSIAFPSTETDQLAELSVQPHMKPNGTKRTTSLFSSATRFVRPTHRTTSLFSAPGTPTEKASPAGASVSNVVSALAGVAATAIPAAILAVTGKDISRTPPKSAEPEATTAESPQSPDHPAQQSTPAEADTTPAQKSVEASAPAGQHPSPEAKIAPLPVNDAVDNPQPKKLVDAPATHQLLPEAPVPADPALSPKPAEKTTETKPVAQVAGPSDPLPANTTPAAIVLTPPSVAPEQIPTAPAPADQSTVSTRSLAAEATTAPKVGPPAAAATEPSPGPGDVPSRVSTPAGGSGKLAEKPGGETPARVSFSDGASPAPGRTPAGSPKRASILAGSPPASPSAGAGPLRQPSSMKAKKDEFIRKTSGWRYSVGSIRSRKTSTDGDRPAPDPAPHAPAEDASPRAKRRSGIFQKIKAVLSPLKHHNKSPTRADSADHSKTLGRTATTPRH